MFSHSTTTTNTVSLLLRAFIPPPSTLKRKKKNPNISQFLLCATRIEGDTSMVAARWFPESKTNTCQKPNSDFNLCDIETVFRTSKRRKTAGTSLTGGSRETSVNCPTHLLYFLPVTQQRLLNKYIMQLPLRYYTQILLHIFSHSPIRV